MRQGFRLALLTAVVVGAVSILTLSLWRAGSSSVANPAPNAVGIPIAVLGDSNSHSYQDPVFFSTGSPERGGAWRASSLQWTEVLVRLRGHELDLGPWVRWGLPGLVAEGRDWLGLRVGRSPMKEDYLHNFANSGAACTNLMNGRFRQAQRLVELMSEQPERWARGVVVIRIGLNDWSGLLDVQARDPAAPEVLAAIGHCKKEIGGAVSLIHAAHPRTRILLFGLGNEADDPANFQRWQSARDTVNIQKSLEDFNDAIRSIGAGDPRIAFFDELAWFSALWGSRDVNGRPAYRAVDVGGAEVVNLIGDDPRNTLMVDRHAGVAWNALLAQALVVRLKESFDLPLTSVGKDEVDRFLAPLMRQPTKTGS